MIPTVGSTEAPLLPGGKKWLSTLGVSKASFSTGHLGSGNTGEVEGPGWRNKSVSVHLPWTWGHAVESSKLPSGSYLLRGNRQALCTPGAHVESTTSY